jgi:hypothetical protein
MMMVLKRFAVVFALFIVMTAPILATDDERLLHALVEAQLTSLQRDNLTWQTGKIITSDFRFEGEWAFGIAVITVPDGTHGEPDLRLFMGKRDAAGNWQLAMEYTTLFYEWASAAPDTLIGFGQKQNLRSAGRALAQPDERATRTDFPRGNPLSRLSLPYASSTGWMLLGGPHGNNGNAVRPWSALDLNPDLQAIEKIRAAREGFVYRSSACPNYIRVDHAEGWQTGYYHVKDEQVVSGEYVERGEFLGYTSSRTGCGGWASGPHVHFTLKYNGAYQNIHNHDIGGWTVKEGGAAYAGCMVRVRDGLTRCKPGGLIYNDGSIGSGYYDNRYDYNRDNVSDLWVVNQRDSGTGSTSLKIASGKSLQSNVLDTKTGMPQQPDWLNTAFASADYNGDEVPDLWVIHRWDGSDQTAFRIMDGANPAYLIADKITALPMYDNSVSFGVADYNRDGTPDIWAIHPRDSATGSVSVRIANGDNPSQILDYKGVAISPQSAYSDTNFAVGDYNVDGYPDLWAIFPRDKKSNSVRVQVISGRDWQTTLVNDSTPLPQQSTDIYSFSFVVADYNNDSYPDLWLVNRINSTVKVISGKNLETELLSGGSTLPQSNTADWLILGSDRAREAIAPQMAKPNRPKFIVNDFNAELRWKVAGLANRYTVTLYDSAGAVLVSRDVSPKDVCGGKSCTTTTGTLGVNLMDNGAYAWSVTARNNYGSVESPRTVFTTDIPGAPVLVAPANGGQAAIDTSFNWQSRPSADSYKLLVKNTVGTFKQKLNVAPSSCIFGLCTIQLSTPLLPDVYTWKVTAKSSVANGKSKSESWTFSVSAATATPTAMFTQTPAPTATSTETPVMTEAPLDTVTPSPTSFETTTAPTATPTDSGLITLP